MAAELPNPAQRTEPPALVTAHDFFAACLRYRWWYLIGLLFAALGTYFSAAAQPKSYRATARVEIGPAFEPSLMIGVSDLAGGAGSHKLNETYATETYDAMRRGVLSESYLKSPEFAKTVADNPALAATFRRGIDLNEINNSGVADINLDMNDARQAATLLNRALDLLRQRLTRHDFEYLERARTIYETELTTATARLTELQHQLAAPALAAKTSPEYVRLDLQTSAQKEWATALALKIRQLALATTPNAEAAAVWVRVITAPASPAAQIGPRPLLAAGVAAGMFTFIFLALLALANLLRGARVS